MFRRIAVSDKILDFSMRVIVEYRSNITRDRMTVPLIGSRRVPILEAQLFQIDHRLQLTQGTPLPIHIAVIVESTLTKHNIQR